MKDTMTYSWVKTTYEGKMANKVGDLADANVGYIVLNRPSKDSIEVAFRCPDDKLKDDMEILNEYEADKMALLFKSRSGNI